MNTLKEYFVPEWVSILFLIAIPFPVFLIAFLARKASPIAKKNKVFYSILGFFGVYMLYVTFGSLNGLFSRVFFPPIVLLYTTFPFAIFLFTVVINLAIFKTIFQNATLEDMVKIHIFRLIGVFFVILAYYETLPTFFALVAGFGDIISAIASIFVAKAIKNNKPYAHRLTHIWNTFGLIDIAFTAISAIVLTKISIDTGSMGVDTLARFPLCFIPAIAPPTIVFLHINIYRKLKIFYP
ncbi:MAG: hypothetical protein U5N85_11530 [Arcicella sp.]|nr:hypothetical protein [Arcicella sp.]